MMVTDIAILCSGSYGYDSRAASIRIIAPPSVAPEATRFEVRVPGADVRFRWNLLPSPSVLIPQDPCR